MNTFSIISDETTKNTMTMHTAVYKELSSGVQQKGYVRFGLQIKELNFKSMEEMNPQELHLSANIIKQFNLPVGADFEVRIIDNEWHIGPYIGMLIAKKEIAMAEKLKKLSSYVHNYQMINGAILAFSLEGVYSNHLQIKGYMYNPKLKEWVKGIFPYPQSILKKTALPRKMREHFQTVLGFRIFNSNTFNKWEMHKCLFNHKEIKPYLPETILYKNKKDVLSFLDEYEQMYIKPLSGKKGVGIQRIKKEGEYALFNDGLQENKIPINSLADELNQLHPGQFLLQQGLELKLFEQSIVDFRLVLMKDYHGKWKDVGLIGRRGVAGKITSNRSGGGQVERGEETLSEVYRLSHSEVTSIRQQFSELALKIGEALDKSGVHFGRLGIDLALDRELNLWVIEINHKSPNDYTAFYAGEEDLFYETRLLNMLYCKRLAGF
ncbi:YheC/YheD family protein [Alkalihalobacillus sp. 1P02AB]|uniref:YheC/YheD family endospore coat-associated protein n=1 Tax=Alkalihalobacillus sp. 1P02AB TaxID=3132260 RepID=UPI0039A75AC3